MVTTEQVRFHVYSRAYGFGVVNKKCLESIRTESLCSVCSNYLTSAEIPSLQFDELPRRWPMNIVGQPIITVVTREFLEELGWNEIAPHLQFGRVFNEHATELPGYLVIRARTRVFFRGVEGSTFRGYCDGCGEPMYHAQGNVKERYLLSSRLPTVPIAESQIRGLILTSRYVKRMSPQVRKKLYIDPLPVIDSPRDGFGDLPF